MNFRKLILTFAIAGSFACGSSDDAAYYSDSVAYATDAAYATDYEDSMVYYATDPLDSYYYYQAISAAQTVAAAAPKYFSPGGCAVAGVTGETLTLTLSNCSGPLGARNITGVVTIAFEDLSGAFGITIDSSDLSINDTMLEVADQGSLVITSDGRRTVEMTTMSTGTSARGKPTTRSGTYTLSWPRGSNCAVLDASFDQNVASIDYHQTIEHLQHCAGECPKSGTLQRSSDHRSVVVEFDGSRTAHWSANNGEFGTVALACP